MNGIEVREEVAEATAGSGSVAIKPRRGAASCAIRLLLLFAALLILLPLHLVSPKRDRPGKVGRLFLRIGCRLLGLRFSSEGQPAEPPVLFVSNHVSWADIFVLGSALPGAFVAKSDVAGWPALGWLARRSGTLFVDRERRSAAGRQSDVIGERLRDGGGVILFPEGTTGDGTALLPFKSALFASAFAAGAPVQPVAIRWQRVGGRPIDAATRPLIAWIDDMELAPHVWALLRAGGAEARLIFTPPLAAGDYPSRRALAEACRAAISQSASSEGA